MSSRILRKVETEHPLETESHDPFHPLHHLPGILDDYFELSEKGLIHKLHVLRSVALTDRQNTDNRAEHQRLGSLLPDLDSSSMSSSEDDPELFFIPKHHRSIGSLEPKSKGYLNRRNQAKDKGDSRGRVVVRTDSGETGMKEYHDGSESSPRGINHFPADDDDERLLNRKHLVHQQLQKRSNDAFIPRPTSGNKDTKPSPTSKKWEGHDIVLQENLESESTFFDFNSSMFKTDDPFDKVAYKLNRIPSFSSSCHDNSEDENDKHVEEACILSKDSSSDLERPPSARDALNERRSRNREEHPNPKVKSFTKETKKGELYEKLADVQDCIDYTSSKNFSVKGELLFNRLLRERARIELKRHMLDDSSQLYVDVHCDRMEEEEDALARSMRLEHVPKANNRFSSDGSSHMGTISRASGFSVDKDRSLLFVV